MIEITAETRVDAPAVDVYRLISSPEWIAGLAARSGGVLAREDGRWRLRGKWKGIELDTPVVIVPDPVARAVRVEAEQKGLRLSGAAICTDEAAGRTRLAMAVTLEPRTLKARVVMKPLALARGRAQGEFARAVEKVGGRIEKRLSQAR